jgi:hypothetical protein
MQQCTHAFLQIWNAQKYTPMYKMESLDII